jgi:formylglycine-generating enzyme required for sulfatase activity
VFAFKPNKLGIHDMAGNIGQFCEDFYDAKHTRRVQRGSDYLKGNESRDWLLSSHRFGFPPTERLAGDIGFSGFRCVLDTGTPAK